MARLAKEVVEKREAFMRSFMEKQKQRGEQVTLPSANDALVSHFGKNTPRMSAERVYEIRDSIFGVTKKDRKAVKAEAAKAPTTAKRGPGRPRKVQPTPSSGAGAVATGGGLFVLKGDVKHLIALAKAAGVECSLEEALTQAVTVLRASA